MSTSLTPLGPASSGRHPRGPVSLVPFTVIDGAVHDTDADRATVVRPVVEPLPTSPILGSVRR